MALPTRQGRVFVDAYGKPLGFVVAPAPGGPSKLADLGPAAGGESDEGGEEPPPAAKPKKKPKPKK